MARRGHRLLSVRLADRQSADLPAVLAIRAGEFGIEILLDEVCAPPSGFVDGGGGGAAWRLDPDLELDELEEECRQAHPYSPALVPVGRTDAGDLLVDFEQLAVVSVAGDLQTVSEWMATIATAIGAMAWSQPSTLVSIGIKAVVGATASVVVPTNVEAWADGAIAEATEIADRTGSSTYRRRVDGGDVHYPTIVLLGPGNDALAHRLRAAAELAHSPLVVITTTEIPGHARVDLTEDAGVLTPDASGLRLEFTPVLTESATAQFAAYLMERADDPAAASSHLYDDIPETVKRRPLKDGQLGDEVAADAQWPPPPPVEHREPAATQATAAAVESAQPSPQTVDAESVAPAVNGEAADADADADVDAGLMAELAGLAPGDSGTMARLAEAATSDVGSADQISDSKVGVGPNPNTAEPSVGEGGYAEVGPTGPPMNRRSANPGDVEAAKAEILAPRPIEIRLLTGQPTAFGIGAVAPRMEAIIVYLAAARQVPADQVGWLFWPRSLNRTAADNALGHIRDAFGTGADGAPRLVIDEVMLTCEVADDVGSDWHRADQLIALAERASTSSEEISCLTIALDLIECRPGSTASIDDYGWMNNADPLYGRIEARLVDAAHRLGDLALAEGRPELAAKAAGQGLMMVPGQEALHRLSMKASALLQDVDGIERSYRAVVRSVEELSGLDEVQPETSDLYAKLTQS